MWVPMKRTTLLFIALSALPCGQAYADKSAYTLFNPTPRDQMRELSTDRPDQTESPYTVDAGHFQIEADIIKYTYDRVKHGGENTRNALWDFANSNIKFGLTNSTDIQFIAPFYQNRTVSDKKANTRRTPDGFGDLTIRLKQNIWGNDGGIDSFGIMPYVRMPTNQNNLGGDAYEGGLIFLYARDLGDGYRLGLMPEMDLVEDTDGKGLETSFLQTVTVSKEWFDGFASYYEFFVEKGTFDNAHWNVMFDTGVTYGIGDNLQLDAGANIGLTKSATDFQPFVGITYRY